MSPSPAQVAGTSPKRRPSGDRFASSTAESAAGPCVASLQDEKAIARVNATNFGVEQEDELKQLAQEAPLNQRGW